MALLARLGWKKSVRPRRALNPRPPDYMSGALPSELPGHTSLFQPSPVQVTVVIFYSKLEVWSRILFFSFAIVRCRNCNIDSSTFLDVMYSHWEQCREVIKESVVCELLQTKFFLYGK